MGIELSLEHCPLFLPLDVSYPSLRKGYEIPLSYFRAHAMRPYFAPPNFQASSPGENPTTKHENIPGLRLPHLSCQPSTNN